MDVADCFASGAKGLGDAVAAPMAFFGGLVQADSQLFHDVAIHGAVFRQEPLYTDDVGMPYAMKEEGFCAQCPAIVVRV